MRVLILWAAACLPILNAQTPASLPGCEPHPEVDRIRNERLNFDDLQKLPFVKQRELRREVEGDLLERFPRSRVAHRSVILFTQRYEPDDLPALQQAYRRKAAENPEDPFALYLAAEALYRTDTPEAIRLAEEARALAPDWPWPAWMLSRVYGSGRWMDPERASLNIERFFTACPASADGSAHWFLPKFGDKELQASVAAALRQKLADETSPHRLRGYKTLWGLEFRLKPPKEHGPVRDQVAADVKRIEPLNGDPDDSWFRLLKGGYKQSGASKEEIEALDERILRQAPNTYSAYSVLYERWKKDHVEPEDHTDAGAWKAYNENYRAALREWMKFSPDLRYPKTSYFYSLRDDLMVSREDALAALDSYLHVRTVQSQPYSGAYANAAEFLLERDWQTARALSLLQKAWARLPVEYKLRLADDTLVGEDRKRVEGGRERQYRQIASNIALAAQRLDQPDAAKAVRATVEGPAPDDKKLVSDYWWARGRLAVLDERDADALAYFRAALDARLEPPRYRRGRLDDKLLDEARAQWSKLGGSDETWALWNKRPDPGNEAPAEGRWEKPEKELASFELADLDGKTWRLRTLEGKSVLINLWATWCGPCRAEMPKLQKLYEQSLDRPDLEVISFNVDDELGLVAPYVAEKGYTFPVLLAHDLVRKMFDGYGIPQNWIIDPAGEWQWQQLGYDSAEPDWVDSMIRRLESVKLPVQ